MIDTIIVGAGPSGLCAAKTILECDPHADIKILDGGSTLGGVWAQEKLYPGLETNHHFGGMDFSDLVMPVQDGARPGKHISGKAVNRLMADYAQGRNLGGLIQFHTRVNEIRRDAETGVWHLTVSTPEKQIMECKKLIIGMGVNNNPNRPQIHGSGDFKAPIMHSSDMGPNQENLLYSQSMNTIAVLGGGKSAYDAVYLAAKAGRQVEWLIRRSGKGPVWVFPIKTKIGPFWVQRDRLPVRRIISFFSPCIWNDGYQSIRNFLHQTTIGKFIAQKFWAQLHVDTLRDCKYATEEKLKPLQPEQSPFWYGTTGGSTDHGDELYDFIRNGRIRITRDDITHLTDHTIHMADGSQIHADALITATGYSAKPTMTFMPTTSHSDLGIPSTALTSEQRHFWDNLDIISDARIGEQFPRLLGGPYQTSSSSIPKAYNEGANAANDYSPSRLYRSIAPPGLAANGDRSLVFLGVFSNFANHARLEIQCLWAYAYLNNKLTIDEQNVFQEASLLSRYSYHRTPFGHGKYFPDHVFDQLPYMDTLLQDLGLNPWRKSNAFNELFEPYTVADYHGIVQEWLAQNKVT